MRAEVVRQAAVLAAAIATFVAAGGAARGADDAAADVGPFAVWRLPAGAGAAPAELDARKGWRVLEPEAAAPPAGGGEGGLAVENPYLIVILTARGESIVLLSKGTGAANYARLDLALVDATGRPSGKIGALKLVEHTQAEAVVSLAAGAVEARLKVGLGKCFVEVAPAGGAAALEVRGRGRFAVLPDFFGNDVLYDATEVRAARAYVPAENFLVHLLHGGAGLVMLTWPVDGGQDTEILAAGEGPERHFAATRVSFNDKSVFVSLLAREGIWGWSDLRSAAKDKTFVAETWRPPFDAQWMTILARRPAVGASAGVVAETMALRSLPAEGDKPYSDVYVHPWVPSWQTGGEWRLHLETVLTHMMTREKVRLPEPLAAINYPRDRTAKTPPDAFTLVDVMRGSLGAGPCEYILDIEGLNKTRSTGAAGTGKPTAAATCSERGGLVYRWLGERDETPRRHDELIATDAALESVEKIKDFLDAAHARIQEYLAWSEEIARLAEAARAEPDNQALAERVMALAGEMRGLWAHMEEAGKPCAFPGEWRGALDHCKDLIRTGAPDVGERVRLFDAQMRGAGEEVDGGMQACRRIVKQIRQEAALAAATSPKALKLAETIRQRCRDVLKNKHYKEQDSIRLSPAREAGR